MKTPVFFHHSIYTSILSTIANVTLFSMMSITVIDVISRSIFNAPIMGSVEITRISLAMMIFATFPLIVQEESHISVDLLDSITPSWIPPIRQCCMHLIGVIVMSLLTYQLYKYAIRSFSYGDVTEFLRIPVGYVICFMVIMGALSVIISSINAYRYFLTIVRPHAPTKPHTAEHSTTGEPS